MKRLRLRKPIKRMLVILLIIAAVGLIAYQLFTVKKYRNDELGNYSCYGGIIKVCSGVSYE